MRKQAGYLQSPVLQIAVRAVKTGRGRGDYPLGEFGRPYLIAHGEDGYCVHLDRKTYKCTVREHRTVPCRGFDCRNNEQWHVWVDYEKKILNPEMEKRIDSDNLKIYSWK